MAPDPACDGCLGSRRCWVCLGRGVVEVRRYEALRPCARCFGSGKCSLCQDILIDDVGAVPHLNPDQGTEPDSTA